MRRKLSGFNCDGENVEAVQGEGRVSGRFFLLLFLGFVLVVVGMVVVLVASVLGGGSVSGDVVIFIGPFPIVLGAGPNVESLVSIGIILAVLSVVLFFVMNRKMRRLGI